MPSTFNAGGMGDQLHSSAAREAKIKAKSSYFYLLYGIIIILQLTIGVIEIIFHFLTDSVLILTNGYFHLFTACNALFHLLNFKLANQITVKRSFGFMRLEVLGILITIIFILGLIFSLIIEGCLQISFYSDQIDPTDRNVLLTLGCLGLLANLFYVFTINSPNQGTTNITNCLYVSLLKNTISPILILFTSAVMFLFDDKYLEQKKMIEPIISVATNIFICISFYPQLQEHFMILIQAVPTNINVQLLKKDILQKFLILENIHELHIWRLDNAKVVITCHIVLPLMPTAQYVKLINAIRRHYTSPQYDIAHITIQPEFSNRIDAPTSNVPTVAAGDNHQVNMSNTSSRVTKNQCYIKCPTTQVQDGFSEEEDCQSFTCCSAEIDA